MYAIALTTWLLAAAPALETGRDTIEAEVVLRVRSGTSSGVLFERIEALEADQDGNVYVLDGLANRLTALDPGGRERWSVGRRGEGPGEFLAPVGLAWAPDGTLWVIDPENQRATVVDTDGQVVETHHVPAGFALSPWPGRFDSSGRFYSYVADGESYDFNVAVYDEVLEPLDVRIPPRPPEAEVFFEGRTDRGSHMRARVPYSPRLIWRLDSSGRFVTTWTAEPGFRRVDGRPLSTDSGREPTPVSVTRGDRDAAIDGLARFIEMGGSVDPTLIPSLKPVTRTFVLDDSDRIWVLTYATSGSHSVWELLDSGGTFLDTIIVSGRIEPFPVPVVRGEVLVGVERDDLDLETIVVARVPGR